MPTQSKKTEKRKEFQTDETAKELRASLPIAVSSHASSLRPSDETQEQPERSSKQTRTAKKGVEALRDVSYLFQTGHCEHQRNGLLQVRMAQKQQEESAQAEGKEDQTEQHDHGTIDEVLGDQDTEERRDVLDKPKQKADLLKQIPLPGHQESEKERPASWCRLARRARVATKRLHRSTSDPPRPFDARDATTQSRDHKHTKCRHLDPKRSTTKWESMCSRSFAQSACASQS